MAGLSFETSRLHGSRSCGQASSSASHSAFSFAIPARRARRLALHASSRDCSRASSASAAALASAHRPTDIFFTRPSIFASASTWMIFAPFGQ
jgi:hypothetical protein